MYVLDLQPRWWARHVLPAWAFNWIFGADAAANYSVNATVAPTAAALSNSAAFKYDYYGDVDDVDRLMTAANDDAARSKTSRHGIVASLRCVLSDAKADHAAKCEALLRAERMLATLTGRVFASMTTISTAYATLYATEYSVVDPTATHPLPLLTPRSPPTMTAETPKHRGGGAKLGGSAVLTSPSNSATSIQQRRARAAVSNCCHLTALFAQQLALAVAPPSSTTAPLLRPLTSAAGAASPSPPPYLPTDARAPSSVALNDAAISAALMKELRALPSLVDELVPLTLPFARPSHMQRYALAYGFFAVCAVHTATVLYHHSSYNGCDDLNRWTERAHKSASLFVAEHISEPTKAIYDEFVFRSSEYLHVLFCTVISVLSALSGLTNHICHDVH
jgi:hypothetical protein